ncbi:peptidoglycan editing factor PgeF [Reyranella sp.]|jgi:YfiH family protein|uniref:peptidoglycan editing factor PgeF n=1 Tax=Reyranella sp. TaxID=1929291 RepID=UPI000BD8F319|nr:peptidoglycan editing factor PgeF [Reyranella sp.]OYY38262.1 MAG: polyphenol oxidase [Rhodospirillales bacterium 35-66-84]OYZ92006.1 MAG: polyphenol oxidase [Rhodospirillales bacterium 24-66-33]OZB23368.1 MAG: polyphenol oxidase [Rhodospirillales bacterium 39-66-50]HQS17667.1 peptidoglycan editing factor PgeF [Reyranella sp.]HQT14487.1 peptidoglycan editing factor PgeF [Reyranella sp.]
MIQAQTLAALDGVQHRFFTRRGGVSTGLFSSLNCGYGSADAPENVRENRRRAAGQFGLDEPDLQTVHQIHSADVLTVTNERWRSPGAPKADGLVTDRPGVALGVMAADCAPVLLADGDASVIGAAHAGWKGALGGVVDATIAAMETLGARRERIQVVVGPCIGPASYEVGPEFPAPFLAQDEANAAFFRTATRAGHFMFDLPGYLVHRIARNGVAVSATGHDTLSGTEDFFSYRRNTLQGVRDYGRGLSAIALAA